MTTDQSEVQYSLMTRIAGQSENVALDVEDDGGKKRAYISSLERFTSFVFGAVSVSTTATALRVGASNAQYRRGIFIQNLGVRSIYVGTSNSVTTATGWNIDPGNGQFWATSEDVTWYGICATGTCDVRIQEGIGA